MEYIFRQEDFITETTPMYSDPEGNTPYKVKLKTLPTSGTLEYGGQPATLGQVIDYTTEVGDGTLKYISDPTQTSAHSTYFYFQVSDVGSENYSNTGKISFNIGETVSAPTVDDNSGNLNSLIYTFSTNSFTLNFTDEDGDGAGKVVIKSLPNAGTLKLLGNDTIIGTDFKVNNSSGLKFYLSDEYAIYSGNLYKFDEPLDIILSNMSNQNYILESNTLGVLIFKNINDENDTVSIEGTLVTNDELCFDFTVKDDSSFETESNVATFCLIPQGDVNIKPIYVNNPPTIGDNKVITLYNKIYEFNRVDFIEETKPAYNDPEGDEPFKVKILTLPEYGELRLSGVPVTIGQEIPIEDIELNKLTYIPDASSTNIISVEFEFTVSDIGSKEYA